MVGLANSSDLDNGEQFLIKDPVVIASLLNHPMKGHKGPRDSSPENVDIYIVEYNVLVTQRDGKEVL